MVNWPTDFFYFMGWWTLEEISVRGKKFQSIKIFWSAKITSRHRCRHKRFFPRLPFSRIFCVFPRAIKQKANKRSFFTVPLFSIANQNKPKKPRESFHEKNMENIFSSITAQIFYYNNNLFIVFIIKHEGMEFPEASKVFPVFKLPYKIISAHYTEKKQELKVDILLKIPVVR